MIYVKVNDYKTSITKNIYIYLCDLVEHLESPVVNAGLPLAHQQGVGSMSCGQKCRGHHDLSQELFCYQTVGQEGRGYQALVQVS